MWRRASVCFLACLSASVLKAQTDTHQLPDAMVGVPYSFDFGQFIDPYLSQIPADIGFSFSFTLADGTLPPGLTIASNAISVTPTQAGTYNFDVNFGFSFTDPSSGMTISFGPFPGPASINVTGNSGPPLAVNPSALTLSFTQGSTSV